MSIVQQYLISQGVEPAAAAVVATHFKYRQLGRGEYFVKEGTTSRQLALLVSGQIQYFSITDTGEEKTTYVSLAPSFAASLLSYLTEAPARENLRTLAPCELWVIDKQSATTLQDSVPAFKDFYIGLLEWQLCCIDKAKFDIITLTAEQRYEKLLHEEPALLQQVPLQYIASMLGITPRHLSRLRQKK
ncbi:MAG: Crp/Fnr family transcriptional regulator [Chitinophagaceae bacterium]|jgi:CRP-like cAMP-binding protein|nr:Crp/Fnr family transcriptional regulator [Chitinophagaceae bacterium]